jgi:hypothetical protein
MAAGDPGLFEPELVCSRLAKGAAASVLNPPMPLPLKPLWAVPATAALGLVPGAPLVREARARVRAAA